MEKNQSFKVGDHYDEKVAALTYQERKDVLEGICYKMTNESYTKQLTQEEQTEKKHELAEVSILISELLEKKKAILAELKAEMTTPTEQKSELLKAIKYKSETRTGLLFYIDDQESGTMYIFDDNAVCVEFRPLRQDEKQTRMRTLNIASNE